MKLKTNNPTPDEVIGFTINVLQYPIPDTADKTSYISSLDISNAMLWDMPLEERFVDSVAEPKGRENECAFVFEKTLAGTKLIKTGRPGKSFYELLKKKNPSQAFINSNNKNDTSQILPYHFIIRNNVNTLSQPNYELNEKVKLLHDMARGLDFQHVDFTGNPSATITNSNGLLEGELINALVTRLQQAAGKKSFADKVAKRKKEVGQTFTQSKNYVQRLYDQFPQLVGKSLVVSDGAGQPVKLATSVGRLDKLITFLEDDLLRNLLMGWWWKREHLIERGNCYHLVLFLDGQAVNDAVSTHLHQKYGVNPPPELVQNPFDTLIKDIGQKIYGEWLHITDGQGVCWWFTAPIPTKKSLMSEKRNFKPPNSVEALLSFIEHRLKQDLYLRLERDPKIPHFSMGKLPVRVGP